MQQKNIQENVSPAHGSTVSFSFSAYFSHKTSMSWALSLQEIYPQKSVLNPPPPPQKKVNRIIFGRKNRKKSQVEIDVVRSISN